jgi:Zinc finger, C2H2 type
MPDEADSVMNNSFLDDLSHSLGLQLPSRTDDGTYSSEMFVVQEPSSGHNVMRSTASETRSTDANSSTADLVHEPAQMEYTTTNPQPGRTLCVQEINEQPQAMLANTDAFMDKLFPLGVPELLNHILDCPNEDKRSASASRQTEGHPKHVCMECGKIFKRAHNLKIHGRLHSGAKPYRCPFEHCDKEFRWKSSIVSHLNWHRTKRGDIIPGFDGIRDFGLITKQLPLLSQSHARARPHLPDSSPKFGTTPLSPQLHVASLEPNQSASSPSRSREFEVFPRKSPGPQTPAALGARTDQHPTLDISNYMTRWTNPVPSADHERAVGILEEGNTVFTPSTRTGSEGDDGSPRFFEFDGLCPSLPFLPDCGSEICQPRGRDGICYSMTTTLQDKHGYSGLPGQVASADRVAAKAIGDSEKDECTFPGLVDVPLFVFSNDEI